MPAVEVALALIQEGGRWLVSRRAPGVAFGGFWEFPGGRIERGETAVEAAVREAREEAGVTVEVIRELGYMPAGGQENPVKFHLIYCRRAGGEPRPSDPAVTEVRWVNAEQLRALEMPPANQRIIAQFVSPLMQE